MDYFYSCLYSQIFFIIDMKLSKKKAFLMDKRKFRIHVKIPGVNSPCPVCCVKSIKIKS